MTCEQVDELGAAFALHAVEPEERLAIQAHLETCSEPHADARETALVLGKLGVDPISPRPELRDRLMSTIAVVPQERDAVLRMVAQAVAEGGTAYAVEGQAGSGFLIDGEGGAKLVLAEIAALADDDIYELWLLDAAGTPLSVGMYRPGVSDGLVVIPLERDPSGYATFAMTVEAIRVETPTSDAVIAGAIGS